MTRSSENQGPISLEEAEAIYQSSRRKRFGDMILILENNGFKVSAVPKAIEQESMQMIAILQARGYDITKRKVSDAKEQEEKDTSKTSEKESPEGNPT